MERAAIVHCPMIVGGPDDRMSRSAYLSG
jgi:hypothetical protein